jgi:beta-lactamase class A
MNHSLSKLFPYLGIFTFGLISGLIISKVFQPETLKFTEFRRSQNYQFISPLLECDISTPTENSLYSQIRTDIDSIINNNLENKTIIHASIYLRDLNNGPWLGVNEREYFSPASLVKVPIMIALYHAAQSDPSILNFQVEIDSEDTDYSEQNILPSQTLTKGQSYSLDELVSHMIIYSDNRAKDILVDYLTPEVVFKTFSDLGIDNTKLINNPDGNNLTVKEYASFFRILYNASYLNRDMSEKALKLLSQTEFNQAITKNLPENIKVAHKYGERFYLDTQEKQLHDCGIVYSPPNPYLLCIMTRGYDFGKLSQVVSQISDSVYQNLNQ